MTDKIDSSLRLVLPLHVDDDGTPRSWAYHTPISMQTFEANYRILATANGMIFEHGMPRAFYSESHVAALRLRDAGKQDAAERGEDGDGGAGALIADLRRLTQVAVEATGGWESVPLDVALQRGAIDAEDVRDVENALVFFSCAFYLTGRAKRKSVVGLAASVSGGSITSLPLSEWIASLPKSTPAATSPTAPSSAKSCPT